MRSRTLSEAEHAHHTWVHGEAMRIMHVTHTRYTHVTHKGVRIVQKWIKVEFVAQKGNPYIDIRVF